MNQPIPYQPEHGKFIDPLVDFAFKRIFGTENNKDLLKALLNEIFRGRKNIIDLKFNKTEYPGDNRDERTVIFDLHCTGDKGEKFIIEIQRSKQLFFKDRTVFYGSRLVVDQGDKKAKGKWDYQLNEVYLVAILDNFMLEGSPAGEYIYDVSLCNRKSGEIFYDKLGYTFIELTKFDKKISELETRLDHWLYLFKHLGQMEKIPELLENDPIFTKFFETAMYANLNKEEKTMYNNSFKQQWDYNGAIGYSRKEGLEEGIAIGEKKGLAIGEQKGRLKGKLEGKLEGKHEEAVSIARNLKKEGLTTEFIAKITKLSAKEIDKL